VSRILIGISVCVMAICFGVTNAAAHHHRHHHHHHKKGKPPVGIGGSLTIQVHDLGASGPGEAYRFSGVLQAPAPCQGNRTVEPIESDAGGPGIPDLAHGGITDATGNWATAPNQALLLQFGHVYTIHAYTWGTYPHVGLKTYHCLPVTSTTITLIPEPFI